jgi:Ca-activated chloride channel family protein
VLPGAPTRGIDFAKQPMLDGYVVTMPKPRASLLLAAPEGDPVLATWGVGIGRAGAFTSDYKDRWGHDWLAWPEAAKLFGQLGRDLARRSDDPRVRLEADAAGGDLHVRADVVGDDGRAQTFRRLVVHVAGPDGFARDVPLDAVGTGRYGATVPLSRPGAYVVTARDDGAGAPVGMTGAVLTSSDELRPTGSDRALLERIAALTGGRVRDTLAGVFDDRAAHRFAYRSLVPPLAIFAAIAMLLAVAARRLGVPESVANASRRWAERNATRAQRRAASAAEHARADALAIQEQERLRDIVRARRQREAHASDAALSDPPRPAQPPAKTAPPAPTSAHTDATPPIPAARPLTSVEELARRRRERR